MQIGLGTQLEVILQAYQERAFALRREVLSPNEILAWATQMTGKPGVIASGTLAEWLVIEANPLKHLLALEQGGHTISTDHEGRRFVRESACLVFIIFTIEGCRRSSNPAGLLSQTAFSIM